MRDDEIEIFLKAFTTIQDRQKAVIRNMKRLERKMHILYLIVILLMLFMCANMFIKMNQENIKSDSISNPVPTEILEELEYLED